MNQSCRTLVRRATILTALTLLVLPAAAAAATPTYRLKSYTKVGQDRSFKCDLVVDLPRAPRVVVFGGSRAVRFRPADITRVTGLEAINASLQNFHSEDGWAIAKWLFWRKPHVKLCCIFALSATNFVDTKLHPGLLYDPRLSRWFPTSLITSQRQMAGPLRHPNLVAVKRFSSRGAVVWNAYDQRREDGYTLEQSLQDYLHALLPLAGNTRPTVKSRSRAYFEKTVRLFNQHGVRPVVVIMPYHPTVLEAFRAVGWEAKIDDLRAYLTRLQQRCDLTVVDLLDIESFGGSPDEFYDGSHVTAENSRRIIEHVVSVAPECFVGE